MSANRPKGTEEDVAEVVARWTGIPVKRIHESDMEKAPPYRRRASQEGSRSRGCYKVHSQSHKKV